jgi:hypothetical protein
MKTKIIIKIAHYSMHKFTKIFFSTLVVFTAEINPMDKIIHMGKKIAEHVIIGEFVEAIFEEFSPEKVDVHGHAECLHRLEERIAKLNTNTEEQRHILQYMANNQDVVIKQIEKQDSLIKDNMSLLTAQASLQTEKIEKTATEQAKKTQQMQAALKSLHSAFDERTKNITLRIKNAAKEQTELLNLYKQDKADQQRVALIQKRLATDQAVIKAGNDSIYCMATIAQICGDRHLAHQIQASGCSLMKIAENTLTISGIQAQVAAGTITSSAATASIAGGWIGIAAGVASLVSSLFGEEEDNTAQIILDAITDLSSQMAQYHQATMESFKEVHKALHEGFKGVHTALDRVQAHLHEQDMSILQGFFALKIGQQDIKNELHKMYNQYSLLQRNADYIAATLSNNQRSLVSNLEELRLESFTASIKKAELLTRQPTISEIEVRQCSNELIVQGTHSAKGAHVTGNNIDIDNPQEIIQALHMKNWEGNPWKHAAFFHINLLRKFAERKWNIQFPTIVNPLIWIESCNAINNLLHKKITSPHIALDKDIQQVDIESLDALHKEGATVLQFIQKLAHHEHIKQLNKGYEKSLDELAQLIEDEIKKYKSKKTLEERTKKLHLIEQELTGLQKQTYASHSNVITTEAIHKTSTYNALLAEIKAHIYKEKNSTHIGFYPYYREAEVSQSILDGTPHVNLAAVPNQNDVIAREYKLHAEYMQKHKDELARRTTSDLRITNRPISAIIHPAKDCGYTEVLPLPIDNEFILTKIHAYIQAEEAKAGSIKFEYKPTDQYLYIQSFFVDNAGEEKLILSLRLNYCIDPLYKDHKNEWLRHCWNGGHFPKSTNVISQRFDAINPSQQVLWARAQYRNWVSSSSLYCYYPPTQAYPGVKNQLPSLATVEVIPDAHQTLKATQEKIAQAQALEQSECAKYLQSQLQPSSNSGLFKAAQNTDLHYALLQNVFMLVNNESMYQNKKMRNEFCGIYQNDRYEVHHTPSISRYLQSIENGPNNRPSQPFQLPELIKTTKQKKLNILEKLPITHGFARVQETLTALETLKKEYLKPRATPQKALTSLSLHDTKQNLEFQLLRQDNQQLKESLHTLQGTVNVLQAQIAALLKLMEHQQTQSK